MKFAILTVLLALVQIHLAEARSLSAESRRIETHLGDTVEATLSLGQVNRIVLPFETPEIRTLNPATAELQGRVLYVAPIDTSTMHLFVSDARDPEASIALRLKPEETHPREIIVELFESSPPVPSAPMPKTPGDSMADAGNETIRPILKTLAMGQIPDGFRFRKPSSRDAIHCRQKFALIQTLQVFEQGGTRILVGVLKNNGKAPLELQEESCAEGQSVDAIATYPSGPLKGGHEHEIYAVMTTTQGERTRSRPHLIAHTP